MYYFYQTNFFFHFSHIFPLSFLFFALLPNQPFQHLIMYNFCWCATLLPRYFVTCILSKTRRENAFL